MTVQKKFPLCLESPSGLRVEVNANGSIKRMDHGDIMLNLFLGNEMEGGPANIYLRRKAAEVEAIPLLGPCSPASFQIKQQGLFANGEWQGLLFHLRLVLAQSAPAWFWHVEIENTSAETAAFDLIYTQDLGLAHYGAVRLNEYYVSHYIDHTPLNHPQHGVALASRQNQSMGGRYPWTVIGSLKSGVSYATDAIQFYGLAGRAGRAPVGITEGLPCARRQHEHSMAAIQDAPRVLEPGSKAQCGFFGWFEVDKQSATSEADSSFIDKALSLAEAVPVHAPGTAKGQRVAASLFSAAPLLDSFELTEVDITNLFGPERRHEERENNRLLSFFTDGTRHVVLKEKDLKVLRPHGHLLRTGNALTPDETALTSTSWMAGVFHSMVTQGHVSINRFLSTCHSYLGLFRSHGLRIFVELDGVWRLLDEPSAYEMAPDSCRWIYKYDGGIIAVRSKGSADRHELSLSVKVLAGKPARFFLSYHVAMNGDDGSIARPVNYTKQGTDVYVHAVPDCDVGWRFPDGGFRIQTAPGTGIEKIGGDELLFDDGASRNQPFLCMVTAPASAIGLRITACLIAETGEVQQRLTNFWSDITAGLHVAPPAGSPLAPAAARVAEILPWFIHNAFIHYLSPRGLEQYSGGGWGTRDVSQGPIEMLLSLGRFEPVRDILLRLFRQQNPDGDWPQWFMFFDRERGIRPGDSHGDIVYWPVLALAQYLLTTEDAGLLNVLVPFFHPEGDGKAEQATLWEHVERALAVMKERVIPGTNLAAYGNGDWNDSLQPVQTGMREHLCSSWTVTLNYQTLMTLAQSLDRLGSCDRATVFKTSACAILDNFQRVLIVDDTIAGFAYFRDGSRIDYLLHPLDKETGLVYSLLPMIHAVINGMLSPQQAQQHLDIIRKHLLGPDGAHLFNRPMQYHGGPQTYFQRAESTTFFGRENGLMYTHAHLRYAEALAHFGDSEGFFIALCRANPIAISDLVPSATLRQANCYYSSSDPAFADRYEAFEHYEKVKNGEVPLDGGWRVYSSGAGICVRLIIQNFLGLRWEKSRIVIDPVMPKSLDGLRVDLHLAGRHFDITYRIDKNGCGPASIQLNGVELPFTRVTNPYRTGAAEIPMEAVLQHLHRGSNRLTVHVG
jgi:1,2-beta-oligoglucan phosphorylase